MAEKRNIDRHRKRYPLRFGSGDLARTAFTEDISTTGLFVRTAHVCNPGSLVKVELTLENEQQVILEARVVWVKRVPPQMIRLARKGGMGLRIVRFVSGEDVYRLLCEELSLPYAELL